MVWLFILDLLLMLFQNDGGTLSSFSGSHGLELNISSRVRICK